LLAEEFDYMEHISLAQRSWSKVLKTPEKTNDDFFLKSPEVKPLFDLHLGAFVNTVRLCRALSKLDEDS
jgi:hypothetical protein